MVTVCRDHHKCIGELRLWLGNNTTNNITLKSSVGSKHESVFLVNDMDGNSQLLHTNMSSTALLLPTAAIPPPLLLPLCL